MLKSFERKEVGFINKVELKKPGVQIFYWIMFAFMLFISIICLVPNIWILFSGLKNSEEFYQMTIIPRSFEPEKIALVWKEYDMIRCYLNSIIQVVGEWAFCIVFNGLAGYVLSRLKPKGSAVIMTVILALLMLPNTMGMVPLYKTIIDFPIIHVNMLGTFWPLWIAAGANCFYILLFKNFFDTIPSSYVEAAKIDGASNTTIFFTVILPLSLPIIMTVSIFSINASWNSFLWPYLVLTKEKLHTVSVFLFTHRGAGLAMDKFMILITFTIIPPFILYCFLQKHIIGGLSVGGIKG